MGKHRNEFAPIFVTSGFHKILTVKIYCEKLLNEIFVHHCFAAIFDLFFIVNKFLTGLQNYI